MYLLMKCLSSNYIPNNIITIGDFATTHDIILLTPEWNSYDSAFDEYILLELYTPTGLNKFDTDYQYSGRYPQGLNLCGVRMWHVDARLYSEYKGKITTNPNIFEIEVQFSKLKLA